MKNGGNEKPIKAKTIVNISAPNKLPIASPIIPRNIEASRIVIIEPPNSNIFKLYH